MSNFSYNYLSLARALILCCMNISIITSYAAPIKTQKMLNLNSPVIEITKVDELQNLSKPVMIKFYLPTCPACRAYAPHFEKAARTIKAEGGAVTFVQINGNDDRTAELRRKYKINTFPTTLLVKDGKVIKRFKTRPTIGDLTKAARAAAQ